MRQLIDSPHSTTLLLERPLAPLFSALSWTRRMTTVVATLPPPLHGAYSHDVDSCAPT
jgi:hypothetical protein